MSITKTKNIKLLFLNDWNLIFRTFNLNIHNILKFDFWFYARSYYQYYESGFHTLHYMQAFRSTWVTQKLSRRYMGLWVNTNIDTRIVYLLHSSCLSVKSRIIYKFARQLVRQIYNDDNHWMTWCWSYYHCIEPITRKKDNSTSQRLWTFSILNGDVILRAVRLSRPESHKQNFHSSLVQVLSYYSILLYLKYYFGGWFFNIKGATCSEIQGYIVTNWDSYFLICILY